MSELLIVGSEQDNTRLDRFLADQYEEYTRSFLQKLIDQGNVSINGISVKKSGIKLKENDEVSVTLPEPQPLEVVAEDIPLDILYEDDDVISLLIHVSRYPEGAAHNWNETYGMVYNKRTGSRIPLSHYVRIKDAAQLQKALEEGKVQELDEAGDVQTFYKDGMFGVSELTDSYVLRKNGNIDLVYGPYGLGPYAAGTMTIPLNREAVAYFNNLNK